MRKGIRRQSARWTRARGAFFNAMPNGEQLTRIAALIDAGHVKPSPVKAGLSLEEARHAHEMLQSHQTRGWLVLRAVN